MRGGLVLEVTRYAGPDRWDWALTDAAGKCLASHRVELDPAAAEYPAFLGLDRYLARAVDPDRPLRSEAELVDRVGRWVGAAVFGPIGPAIVAHAPVAVEVRVPIEARELLFRPLEIAVVGGAPLAVQDVSLVLVPPAPVVWPGSDGAGEPVRMLAVFSVPDGEPALVPRAQRHALVSRLDGIQHRYGKAIELRVLQYGVTRDRLRAALEHGDGWDVVQFSGHGRDDALIVEGPDGRPDPVPLTELIRLLRAGRRRLKLLVLSSGNPVAAPRDAVLRRRAEPDSAAAGSGTGGGSSGSDGRLPVLADEAVRRLGCGVLAMRSRVDDDFSIALTGHLYESMFRAGQPLTRALQLALPRALGDRPVAGVPPRSVGLPALFGARCLDLRLVPPDPPPAVVDPGRPKMSGFPPAPDRFVGRTAVLSRAAAALAGRGTPGLLLTGPAGIGTTAAAVELAYRQETEFGTLVWHQASVGPPGGTLAGFAGSLDRELPGLRMAEAVDGPAGLAGVLPRLTGLMEHSAVLVVLDGIDQLLGPDGHWRDPTWRRIVDALLGHDGLSRLVLTGTRRPAAPHRLLVEEMGPLPPAEAVLLARQLPRFGALIRGRSGIPAEQAKDLVAGALTGARGVPAAVWAAERRLRPDDPVGAGPADPEYRMLLDRWMAEID